MTGTRPVGVVVTVLVVLALAVGGVAAGVSAGGHSTQDGVESEGSAPGGSVSGPTFDGPGIAQGSSEVGLELRPTNQTVAPGGNATYDIVITDPENGTSGYSFNVSVGNLGVAEINGFTLDRNPLADNSFITDDNRTLALDVALGGNNYAPAPEVTVATVNVTAVGSPDDSTDIGFEYDPDQSVLDNDNILYTVTSDQSASLRVDAPPEFLVSNLTPADATVVEDETLNISADVTNVGRSGTQTVSLDVDGLTRDETVTLGNGQNQTVTFEAVDTGVLGAGGYQHTVSSANESVSGNLTVLSAANFAVSLVGTTTPVAGERLNVTAEVTNTGDVEDTQTIALAVGALGGDSTNVTLAGGVSTNVTLSVGTSEGDAGEYTATASSADDSASTNVTVLEPANVVVSIAETNTPVTEGESLSVTATVTNTGGAEDTQTVELTAGTLGSSSTSVTLGGGVSTNVTLSASTGTGDAGAYTATVSSADDAASANVTVLEPANFAVTVTETTTPVAGERLNVTAEITNTGDVADTQTIELAVGALGSSSTSVSLGGGASTSVTLSVGTSDGDAGAYTATVSSADDSETANVTVLSAANFAVSLTAFDSEVTAGENASVDVEVVNTGDVEATQTVTLDVGALGSNATTVTLATGKSTNLTLSVPTQEGDGGEYTATVSSADDTETATVTVLAQAGDVGLSLSPVDGTAGPGGNATYNITVTGADNGISAYSFNVSVADLGVAEIDGFTLDRTGFFDNSFITGDNRTLALDVGLGENGYGPATAVTVATVNVTAVGGPDDATDVGFEYDPNQSVFDAGEVSYTVTSAQSATFTVDAPPEFLVSNLTPTDASVIEGETLNISADVTNVGGSGTQTVSLEAGGLDRSQTVTLGNGENRTVTFESVDTGVLGAGGYQHTVSSANESVSGNLTVLAPAAFAVDIAGTNAPVVAGERLNVTAEITNTGDIEDSQTITLDAGALGSDSTSVTLGGDVSTNLTLSVGTGSGDAGEYTATVSSANESVTATATVLAPANFAVSITETATPVAGEQLTVTAEIQNTGDVADTQTIDLDAGALGADSTGVTLGGGVSTNVTLSVATGSGDAGEYTATVSSTDDADAATVTVLAPAELVVSITETTTPVAGENLSVTATVENTGDVEDTQTIDLDAGALGTDSTTVTLDGGASTNVTLSVSTGAGDAGTYTAAVSGADDSETASVTVLEPATFAVSIPETSTPVEGEQLTVTAEIQNTGDVEDTQTIGLDAGALGTDSASVTLAGDASTNLTLSVGTGSGDAGEYTATVSSADDAASANVTVLAPANFAVSITETSTPVEGEQLTVTAEIQNTGDIEDTQTIGLDAGALGTDSTSVTLAGGASTSLTLSVGTGSGDAGAYTATVSSADEMATANVTVLAPGSLSVTITETSTPVEGEQLNVSAEIANTGEEANTQTVALDVGSLGSASTSVTLAGGASTNVTLSVSTGAGDAGAYTATVSSADDADTASVTVLAPAAFAVDLVETSAPVEGERLVVTTAVENTGGVEGTQTLTLDVGALGSNSTSVTLGGGESTNLTLSVGTGSGDAGEYTATVSGADDVDSATVTVLEPAAFAVTLADAGGPVTGGETLTVEYAVENTGDVTATQTVAFAVDGTTEATESNLTLAGGETFAGEFSYETDEGDAPGVTVSVASADDTATANVTVLAPAAFAVELTGTGGSVVAGESLTVSYEVTNTGDVGATQTVEFAVEGTVEATESVTLGGGETFAGGFSYETTGGDVPKLNVSVASADDTVTETVTVLSPGAFVVELTSLDDSVVAGENLTVAYEVTNSGDTEATQTVEIAVAGTVEDTQSVTLGGGETFAGEFSYETGEGDVPGLNVLVSSVDDTVTATVPVLEPAAFAVTLTDVAGPVVAGESLTVGYEVTNTGGVEATQTVEFAVDGVTEDTEANVTLGGGETFAGQFAYETIEEDVPGVTVSVSSADDTVTETVAVLEPALFDVSLTGIDSEVTAGETVTVGYEVTNTGDIEATQTVKFAVEGTVEDSESNVTLGGGETFTRQFAYETVEEDVPGVTVSVSSADDTATESVTVLAPVDPTPALSNLTIAGDGNETLVLDGAGENVTVDVTNLGTTSTAFNVTLTLEGPETVELTETVAVGGGETTALTFENATDAVDAGAYNVTLSATDTELTGALTVSVTVDDGQPATDTTGDARLNDIDGDRAFSIFDVQELFVNFQTPTLQNNPAAFNFDGSGDGEVNIFDVQALFVELVLQDT